MKPSESKRADSDYQAPQGLDFITALETAIKFGIHRSICGTIWPLISGDFWKDRVVPLRKVLESFIEPMLEASLKAQVERESLGESSKVDLVVEEYKTVLSYLVAQTQDKKLIKDEVRIVLPFYRRRVLIRLPRSSIWSLLVGTL